MLESQISSQASFDNKCVIGRHIYTVSEFSNILKHSIEDQFTNINIQGEISNLKKVSSGHTYFNVRDKTAIINAVCWKGTKLPLKLTDGLSVICIGNVSTYRERSNYQIIIKSIEIAGIGALLALLEKRKIKLTAEGLFDLDRKKKIPAIPRTVGVITSIQGAVLQDIIHRIKDRFPAIHLLVWGVSVQGTEAAAQIIEAINGFGSLPLTIDIGASLRLSCEQQPALLRPDVLIIARGGGAIEDLFVFNEEPVVQAIARAEIPIVSAIGHETDTTLADLAADLRAPTPTAAAELITPYLLDIRSELSSHEEKAKSAIIHLLERRQTILLALGTRTLGTLRQLQKIKAKIETIQFLISHRVRNIIQKKQQNIYSESNKITPHLITQHIKPKARALALTQQHITSAIVAIFKKETQRFQNACRLLSSYSHGNVLKRGFAIVRTKHNTQYVIKSAMQLRANMHISIEFSDGTCEAVIQNVREKQYE